MLIGYAAACAPPVFRAWKTGTRPWELIPVLAVIGSQVGYAALGANAVLPAVAAGLIGADVVCRIIVLRHRGEAGPVLAPMMWLTTLPLLIGASAPTAWTANGWAGISLALVVLSYGSILYRGTNELLGRAGAHRRVTH